MSYSFPRVKEIFRFDDEDDYDYEIRLQVFSRILGKFHFTIKVSTVTHFPDQ